MNMVSLPSRKLGRIELFEEMSTTTWKVPLAASYRDNCCTDWSSTGPEVCWVFSANGLRSCGNRWIADPTSATPTSRITTDHWRRRRSTAMCAGPYTYAPSASTDSHTDMLIRMPPSAPSASCSKARIAVAFPSSVCSRHTNPGAASATAFTESSAATKPASRRLSNGAVNRPMFTCAST